MGEGTRRPDVEKRATASDPETWILSIPAPIQIGIGSVGVVVDLLPDFGTLFGAGIRVNRAMAS